MRHRSSRTCYLCQGGDPPEGSTVRVPAKHNPGWWVEVSQDKTRYVCPDHSKAWLGRHGNHVTVSRVAFDAAGEATWQTWLASGAPALRTPRKGFISHLRRRK